jgi:hypothetical protein
MLSFPQMNIEKGVTLSTNQNLVVLLAINLVNVNFSLLNVQIQFVVQLSEATLNLQ